MSQRYDRAIDADPLVKKVAQRMNVSAAFGLREAIVAKAQEQVQRWIDAAGLEADCLDVIHRLVLSQTGINIQRVETDEQLAQLSARYQRELPALPVQLEFEFSRDTEALVFRKGSDPRSASKFIAVVDARGERSRKAWFAERHEPGHVLIRDPSSANLWRRTRAERPEPIEQVVDAVAAAVGFWEPLSRPVLERSLAASMDVLSAFDDAQLHLAPEASVEASYRAFARLYPRPLVLLRAEFACRKGDPENRGDSYALRARTIVVNDAALATGLVVPWNHRIPQHSIISRRRESILTLPVEQQFDNLARWTSSRGGRLLDCDVLVTAQGGWAAIEPAR